MIPAAGARLLPGALMVAAGMPPIFPPVTGINDPSPLILPARPGLICCVIWRLKPTLLLKISGLAACKNMVLIMPVLLPLTRALSIVQSPVLDRPAPTPTGRDMIF